MKKQLAFLMALSLTVPASAMNVYAGESIDTETAKGTEYTDADEAEYTDAEETEAEIPRLYPAPESFILSSAPVSEELPESVDLRRRGKVSSIKDQGSDGTCWAHAVIGSIESEKISEDPSIDLSERYLAYYMSTDEFGEGVEANVLENGSTAANALALLTNWIGPVSENKVPYDTEYFSELSRKEVQNEAELHVTGVHTFCLNPSYGENDEENNAQLKNIKKAVNDGHALYMDMNFDTANSLNNATNALFNDPDCPYKESSSHALLVVGYDDNYSADNFNIPPKHDGAWLLKNSWGADYGSDGYYWVSYEEVTANNFCYFDIEDAHCHDNIYEHDDFGGSGLFAASEDGDETVYISNVFTAEEAGFVTDIMLDCIMPGDQYDICIYTGLQSPDIPDSGEIHGVTSGVMTDTGYQTISLSEPVHVNEGETYSVVVKLSGEVGYHIACEYAANSHGQPVGFSYFNYNSTVPHLNNENNILATFGKGQSFFSTDGNTWNDVYDSYAYDNEFLTGNICLKALTVNEGAVHFSNYNSAIAPGTEISLSCADGKDIYFSVNGGEFALYNEPIVYTGGDMSVSAYIDGNSEQVYTQNYTERSAALSSLLVNCGSYCYYADLSDNVIDITLPVYCDTMTLLPIMSGTLTSDDQVYSSYDKIELPVSLEPGSYSFTLNEDGLASAELNINLSREYTSSFSCGTWLSNEENCWYYFAEDGMSGYRVDIGSGKKTEFTYTIDQNIINMNTGDSVRTGFISSDASSAKIQWDNGELLNIFVNQPGSEKAPFYTNPDLADMAKDYYKALTGNDAKNVSCEFGESFIFAVISIKSENGEDMVFEVDRYNAVGTLNNGDVVDLKKLPDPDTLNSFRPGTWTLQDESGNTITYYCFNENGSDGYTLNSFDGSVNPFKYQCVNGQMQLSYMNGDEVAYVRKGIASIKEDTASITWESGDTVTFTYYSQDMIDSESYYSDNALMAMASTYYEAATLDSFNFNYTVSDGDDCIIYAYYSSDPEAENVPFYRVNRFTAKGYDNFGNEADLNNPVYHTDVDIKSGMWRISTVYTDIMSADMLDYYDYYVDGHYWFDDDSITAIRKDAGTGENVDMKFYMINGKGIAYRSGERLEFTYTQYGENLYIHWGETEFTAPRIEKLTYISDENMDTFKCYSLSDLIDWAVNDTRSKTGIEPVVGATGMYEDGSVNISLFDPENDMCITSYTVDLYTGKGTDQFGEPVDLPQTGITSPKAAVTAFGAALSFLAGFGLVVRSGFRRRKDEE